jgi:hypothetical protein
MAGQSLKVVYGDFNHVFKAVLYFLKYQPSHGSNTFNTTRKSLFRFRAKKQLPGTALGPALIQVPGWTSDFLMPCTAPCHYLQQNKRGWGYPRRVDVNGNDVDVIPLSTPMLRDLV